MSDVKARDALAGSIKAQRAIGMKGHNWDNYAVAQNILHEEIGHVAPNHPLGQPHYEFDTTIRDRLLAHGRQDTAHALANTTSLLKEVQILNRNIIILFWGVLVGFSLIAWRLLH